MNHKINHYGFMVRINHKQYRLCQMPLGATPYCSDLSSGGVVTLLHSKTI